MPSAVEVAVDTYIRMFSERDPAVRARMLDACFAVDGRMVTRSREIKGRSAFAAFMNTFIDDPKVLRIRAVGTVEALGTTFRFRNAVEFNDGTVAEGFDAGEIDSEGRISLILTFPSAAPGSGL